VAPPRSRPSPPSSRNRRDKGDLGSKKHPAGAGAARRKKSSPGRILRSGRARGRFSKSSAVTLTKLAGARARRSCRACRNRHRRKARARLDDGERVPALADRDRRPPRPLRKTISPSPAAPRTKDGCAVDPGPADEQPLHRPPVPGQPERPRRPCRRASRHDDEFAGGGVGRGQRQEGRAAGFGRRSYFPP